MASGRGITVCSRTAMVLTIRCTTPHSYEGTRVASARAVVLPVLPPAVKCCSISVFRKPPAVSRSRYVSAMISSACRFNRSGSRLSPSAAAAAHGRR
jgi:hypothetical protein